MSDVEQRRTCQGCLERRREVPRSRLPNYSKSDAEFSRSVCQYVIKVLFKMHISTSTGVDDFAGPDKVLTSALIIPVVWGRMSNVPDVTGLVR